jgi:hypothetical protein
VFIEPDSQGEIVRKPSEAGHGCMGVGIDKSGMIIPPCASICRDDLQPEKSLAFPTEIYLIPTDRNRSITYPGVFLVHRQ